MKSRKQLWMWTAGLCLLSLALIAVSSKVRPTSVLAANRAGHAGPNAQPRYAPILPRVEEFTLTPPNSAVNMYKTTLAVRFKGTEAENLAAHIPMILGDQKVVLQRDAENPRIFCTHIDFDWQAFAEEQQRRKVLASTGSRIPIFDGRQFLGMERMQFVEPDEIRNALEAHQSIHFSDRVLSGGSVTVYPDSELMITRTSVAEDLTRVYDGCLSGNKGNQNGAWTFKKLMMAIANTSDVPTAERMLNSMLSSWQTPQNINGFTVPARTAIGTLGNPGTGFLANWPVDLDSQTGQYLPSLQDNASPPIPLRLNAIVNRLDLGKNFNPATGGELRFVFSATAGSTPGSSCVAGQIFNIILEFHVPFDAYTWASRWNSLPNSNLYNVQLQSQITDAVLNSCATSNCLDQIRTNEFMFSPTFWEMREFHLIPGPLLQESTVAMTPDTSFNTAGRPLCGQLGMPACNTNGYLNEYIYQNQTQIVSSFGALPLVPGQFPTTSNFFLGGSAFNDNNHPAFWQDNNTTYQPDPQARVYFSANTCNGCHGRETGTFFLQVTGRAPGTRSNLSNFLLGCQNGSDDCSPGNQQNPQCSLSTPNLACVENVPDPTGQLAQPTAFGDIANRVTYLQQVLSSPPRAGGMLLPFVTQPVGVH